MDKSQDQTLTYVRHCDLDLPLTVRVSSLQGRITQRPLPDLLSDPALKHAGSQQALPSDLYVLIELWSGNNKLEDLDQIRPGEINHVHFQDVPDLPRELLDNNTRVIPGDGVAPIVPMLKKLADKGYAGPLSVELFHPTFRNGSPYDVAREIKRKCDAVLAKAGVT